MFLINKLIRWLGIIIRIYTFQMKRARMGAGRKFGHTRPVQSSVTSRRPKRKALFLGTAFPLIYTLPSVLDSVQGKVLFFFCRKYKLIRGNDGGGGVRPEIWVDFQT